MAEYKVLTDRWQHRVMTYLAKMHAKKPGQRNKCPWSARYFNESATVALSHVEELKETKRKLRGENRRLWSNFKRSKSGKSNVGTK